MKKIAILSAMKVEIELILRQLKSYKIINYANNQYYLAHYYDKELVIAYSKIGKVFSSLTTIIMIEHFNIDILLFIGVAGGLQNLKLGDIIAGTYTVQHDFDLTAFGYQYGEIPSSKTIIQTSSWLLNKAKNIAKKLNYKLYTGIIATGDQFVSSKYKKYFIIKEFNAKAVEMEGASVNLICNEMGIPSLILRIISDYADDNAAKEFNRYIKIVIKKIINFIIEIIINI